MNNTTNGSESSRLTSESNIKNLQPVPNPKLNDYRAIAYVTVPASDNWRWIGTDSNDEIKSGIDTQYVTAINFAFGMIQTYQFEENIPGCPLKNGNVVSNEAYKDPSDGEYHYKVTLDGWIAEMNKVVHGGRYLKAICDLRRKKPGLQVLVSIGGWMSDGFSYMASTEVGRQEFIDSCIDLIKKYDLDGIDLDWEFPTNGGWGCIAHIDNDVENANLLLVEMRDKFNAIFSGAHKLITVASGTNQQWVSAETFKALDYVNVMCYDYNPGMGGNQAGLAEGSSFMLAHAEMVSDTPQNRRKLNLGVPFYNEGGATLVPFYKGWSGHIDASPQITRDKMNWVKENGFGGGFYWAYSMDTFIQDVTDPNDTNIKILQRTLFETLNGEVL
jgi:GH18 family chitinase